MSPPAKRLLAATCEVAVLLVFALVITRMMFAPRPEPMPQPGHPPTAQGQPTAALMNPSAGPTSRMKSPDTALGVLANSPDFRERPLPVAYESRNTQWTAADGRDTNVIRLLAHNPLEYDRMVEENPRIFRRQLVYLKESVAAVFEKTKLTGKPVQQLTLPGVDGQELQFEIVKGDNQGSSRQGTFYGHLAGKADSLVTLAFQDGREAFTVLAPHENLFVVGEPREPGQVIIKAIDPNTYGLGPQDSADVVQTNSLNK